MQEILKREQVERYREQLKENELRSKRAQQAYREYKLDQSLQEEAAQAPLTYRMPTLSQDPSLQPAEPVMQRQESYFERKKREKVENQWQKAKEAAAFANRLEGSEQVQGARSLHLFQSYQNANITTIDKDELKLEQSVLNARLIAIDEQEKASMMAAERDASLTKTAEKDIRLRAQEARIQAYHVTATQMPLGSKERTKLMQQKEEAILKADLLRRQLKVAKMPEGAEKKRDAATIKRHAKFDALKRIFRTPSLYSREDAAVTLENNKTLVNQGRATMGGTKAMYVLEERTAQGLSTGEEWLFKEATNCVGMAKPEGAVVTAEASKLQQYLRGNLSIPAQCLKDESGKVVGSIQKRVQKADGGTDLFKWQAREPLTDLPETTRRDLMHEHTLDWLLCNFDTKGENFINQEHGHIISFDKEESFNTLFKKGSRTMSYDFKPHSNDTIYNTMFRSYANGTLNLDLNDNLGSIQKMEQMSGDDFIAMFRETLDTKYGTQSKDRQQAEQLLRQRHRDLRKTYRDFYTQLVKERIKSTLHIEEKEELQSMLADGTFVFADERPDEFLE